MVRLCKIITKSRWFNALVFLLILTSSTLVGLETSPTIVARYAGTISFLDNLILWLFALEIAIRITARGNNLWLYFYDRWNVFDLIIVAICLLSANVEALESFYLVRVLRVFRIVTVLPKMQHLVGALLEAIPSIGYVTLLLLVIFYVYAILGVQLFGRNDPVNFGTIGMSMVSLFRIVTLEDWTDLLYRQMFGSAVYQYSDFPDVAPESNPMPVIAVIYFVSFVLLGTMIVLNLFVGVILNGMSDNQAKAEFRKLAEARRNQNLSVNEEVRLLSAKVDELKEGLDLIEARIIGENEYGKRRRNRFLRSRRKRQLRVLSGGESSVG